MTPIFIYTLNCPITGIVRYCGQTPSPDKRLSAHIRRSNKRQYHSARWICSLLAKGLKPVMEILDVVPDSEADFWEREYIQNFRERGFDLTNFCDGGGVPMRGKKHSPEARAKMSVAQTGEKNPNFGKKHSPETLAKIGAASKGRTHSPETRAKIGAHFKGKKLPPKTPEHRAKISAARKGQKLSPETRAKIGAHFKGKKLSLEICAARMGRKCSLETRAKLSVAAKNRSALK